MTNIMRVIDFKKHYYDESEEKTIKAVDGVSFKLRRGEVLGIIGESGCGKSTLGRNLIGLESPTEGRILFEEEDIEKHLKKDRLSLRKNIQMIYQNPFDVFDPRYKIGKVLDSTIKIHNRSMSREDRMDFIFRALKSSGIEPVEDFVDRYPHELSGGQLQRISIIRSMLLEPKVIIADEPVSMLDISIRADIINLLIDLVDDRDTSMIFISHDIATTRHISDRIAVMYLGRFVEIGDTDKIIKNPVHPYTRALISNCGTVDPRKKLDPIRIGGEPPTPIDTGPGCYFANRCYMSLERCKSNYPDMVKVSDNHYVSCFNIE